jgi:phenylacetate-CoA ligase
MAEDPVPTEVRRLQPLITSSAYDSLRSVVQHLDAPRWNFQVGDKLIGEDLEAVEAFRARHASPPVRFVTGPSEAILRWLDKTRARSWFLKEQIPAAVDVVRDWPRLPLMSREDLALRLSEVIPEDADLERLITYDTSGTTGHAIHVPTHPQALARAHVLCEAALRAYGVDPSFREGQMACINVCAQQNTYVFTNTFSVWNQATFAKVNLNEAEWPEGRASAQRFFEAMSPRFITADPVAIAEMIRWDLPVQPGLIFSTAVALSPGLKALAQARFGCPVVDWYSLTETGPIAFSAPDGRGMVPVTDDLYVEVVGADGAPVPDGEWGEIAVTGGRNPYLPLLRYRTGDRARMERGRIAELEGRRAVYFRAADGSTVNPVDIARILRAHCAFVQHEFVQWRDGGCTMTIRPAPGVPVDVELMERLLQEIFGAEQALEVQIDEELGSTGKVLPYRSELESPF